MATRVAAGGRDRCPPQRAQRLALLAAAQDGSAAHECLIQFWRRILAPVPRGEVDRYVGWNVPQPPADPSIDDVVAYAELTALATDPEMHHAVRQQYWRNHPESIRDRHGLYIEVGEVVADVVTLVSQGVRPHGGSELDRFVNAHADARGERDTPQFREHMLIDATDNHHRIHRYWALTAQLLGTRITVGPTHDWLYNALARPTELADTADR
ncbi:hypothetical protein OG225_42335 (plasmid) [Nocardia sp. NBC_01377]|uniref:hypothetical protein n=1 Tax=Nocardia sp. NBC_01377 TaxID=2903595 RepID=UPI002F911677